LVEGDLCDSPRAMAAEAEGCGDEVRWVGVAAGLFLGVELECGREDGVAMVCRKLSWSWKNRDG
jgi:hypothetical protein